ncbi:hypothetical protein [Flavobacterium pectinovorum]|uniref:Uncharacterized protein n=1 Tax=Flavobacterium pectinovorum TaxID=29533 RepID=A0A502EP00_9FLAO|nr:hypothetical protein [Flavobacterium pectinovorum]TPG38216.1 hypothetical protein EAH81_17465 [Flavobacterium pectinovorum]
MKQFYSSTYSFWIISRIAFILLGFLELLRVVFIDRISLFHIFLFIYVISFFVIFYKEITKSTPSKLLKYSMGTLTILIGLYCAYLKFIQPQASWGPEKYQFDFRRSLYMVFQSGLYFLDFLIFLHLIEMSQKSSLHPML